MKTVHVLGDSIAFHYFPYLQENLRGKMDCTRKGMGITSAPDLNAVSSVNGGDSSHVLNYLTMFGKELRFDALLLNCGLHDIKTVNGVRQKSETEYRANLEAILQLINTWKKPVFWVNSTPVDDAVHQSKISSFSRYNRDLLAYNAIAAECMSSHHVPVLDLYDFTTKLGGEEIYIDHVHYFEPIRKLQAALIAGHLMAWEACGLF